ncbi:MAG: hypothetical protein N3A01_01120 [Bacteroidales bacterium]|nr:hypothetical protein [Bacteroidales bacterium]
MKKETGSIMLTILRRPDNIKNNVPIIKFKFLLIVDVLFNALNQKYTADILNITDGRSVKKFAL